MANVDKPNGFTAIKTVSGAPVSGLIRTVGMGDGEDVFMGDFVNLASGLALPADTADTALLGVAVGFGKFGNDGNLPLGPYDPDNLTTLYYDDSASTHTEWVCYYLPADDVIFEAQTATALTLLVGGTCDIADAGGGTVLSGRSTQEITTSSNGEFTVVEIPSLVDNDYTLAAGRYWVMATRAAQALHA